MKNLFRNILALLAGIVAGGITIALIQALNVKFYPRPPVIDFKDQAAMAKYMAGLPVGAFLIVLLSYLVGFTLAVFLAIRLSVSTPERQGLLATMFFGAASVLNLMSLPHPMWFWIANLAVLIVAAMAGGKLGRRARPAEGPTG
jgi:hypothetical protein